MTPLGTNDEPDPPEATVNALTMTAAALGQLRRELDASLPIGAERIEQLFAQAAKSLQIEAVSPATIGDWLILLDELELLCRELERRRETLAQQARSLVRHRQAETAYHGTGYRP
jgi:hypothetical protein